MPNWIRFILFLPLTLILNTEMKGQYFNCLEVTDEGRVQIYWSPPCSQAEFVSYQIYSRVPPGGFVPIHGETNYNNTEYLDNRVVGNTQSVDYYIITSTATLGDIVSETLSTIHLTLSIVSNEPEIILLEWNAVSTPLPVGSETMYKIHMHNTIHPTFVVLDSTTDIQYALATNICASGVYFRIIIESSNACRSASNTTYDVLGDLDAPPMPRHDSVSIDQQTGEVILGWSPSTAGDADKYFIYHDLDDITDIYDTVFGRNTTSYIDNSFDPCIENRAYAIAAEDSCGNTGPGTYDIPQRTILLYDCDFDPCTMVNTLTWTPYINMYPELEGYRIYMSIDGGNFQLHETVDASVTEYEHSGLEPGRTYSYFIRAFSNGYTVTSSSCIKGAATWAYQRPVDNQMENASIENSEFASLVLLPDTQSSVPYVNIYRSESSSGPWELLDEMPLQGQAVAYYDDLTADVNSMSYYYYTSITDSCGNEVLESDHMRTIFLEGEQSGQVNTLDWNAFEGWPDVVNAYELYRAVNDDGNLEAIALLDGSTHTYEDDILSVPGDFSLVRYIVRAQNDDNASMTSWSNEIFFEYTPNLYLPNAFRPGGQNPVFKPVGNFADFSDYRLEVYNRWGELIFFSDDFGQGWDGTFKGGDAPAGVYVCVLNYRSANGKTDTLKTSFVLIR